MASDLMKAHNLLFADTANPCYVPPKTMHTPLGEINTGNAYYDYYEQKNLTDNDVIVPLMLFADGMQIDKNGCICQEPWMYTLGILKRHICNQPRAWRNIGLTKFNAHNMYSNDEIWQSKKLWNGRRKPQSDEDLYIPDTLLDWHSQFFAIFEMLLQVQQFHQE